MLGSISRAENAVDRLAEQAGGLDPWLVLDESCHVAAEPGKYRQIHQA